MTFLFTWSIIDITIIVMTSTANSMQNIEIREDQKCLHPQRHLQLIDSKEANRACTEQEIK